MCFGAQGDDLNIFMDMIQERGIGRLGEIIYQHPGWSMCVRATDVLCREDTCPMLVSLSREW